MKTTTQKATLFILYLVICIHITGQGSGNTLTFNGSNTFIEVPHNTNIVGTNELTYELWFNANSLGGVRQMIGKSNHAGGGSRNQLGIWLAGNNIRSRSESNTGRRDITGPAIQTGIWYHVAAVWGGTYFRLYLNGEEVASTTFSASVLNQDTNPLKIGCDYQRCGSPFQNYVFNGQIDEVRIWTSARTPTQIRENMCKKLVGNEVNLGGYWRLDEGAGVSVTDLANGNDGTLSVSPPAWGISGAPIGDESDFWHGVAFSGNTFYHQSSFGDSLSVTNIVGAIDGLHIYSVDELPNSLLGTSGTGANDHYYGVFIANNPSASFDATYHYGNNPAFLASQPTLNENDIVLYNRGNNATNLWANSGATPIVANQTITTNNTFRQEYIIGLENGEALPIELLYFSPSVHNDRQVKVNWITSSERNNDFFTLERSKNGFDFEEIATVKGAGNSVEELEYSFIDESPYVGVSYYRLKQTDFDGSYSYSSTKSVSLNSSSFTASIFPNPVKNSLRIHASEEIKTIQFFSGDGRLVQKQESIQSSDPFISIDLSSGVYLIRLESVSKQVTTKRILVQ